MHQKLELNNNHLGQSRRFLSSPYDTDFSELSYNIGLQYKVSFFNIGMFF